MSAIVFFWGTDRARCKPVHAQCDASRGVRNMPNATRRAVCGKVVAGALRVTLYKHLLKCQGVGPLNPQAPLGGVPNPLAGGPLPQPYQSWRP